MTDELAIRLYQSIHEDDKPRIFEHWHASSIAMCPRAHYFTRLGVEPISKPTAANMLRWKSGHLMEEVIREHLQKLYPSLLSNIRVTSEEMDLTGEFDNYSIQEKTLIEVKTVGPRAPRFKKSNEERHHLREDGPYLAHEYQNHTYVLLLKELGLEVEKIAYVYITLEGLIITYETEVQPKLLANIQKRLEALKKASKDKLPPCLCREDHPLWKSCTQFCPFRGEDGCCGEELIKEVKDEGTGS